MPYSLNHRILRPRRSREIIFRGRNDGDRDRVLYKGLLKRHVTGDYGDICDEDEGLNDIAIKEGTRILSIYKVTDELTIWSITEADRSSTCILLPDEY